MYFTSILILVVFWFHSNKCVMEISDSDFAAYASTKPFLMVKFLTQWCSDCKNMAPAYQSVSDTLGQYSSLLVQADCEGRAIQLCNTNNVKSYPQVKVFSYGNYQYDYLGDRSYNDLLNFVKTSMATFGINV